MFKRIGLLVSLFALLIAVALPSPTFASDGLDPDYCYLTFDVYEYNAFEDNPLGTLLQQDVLTVEYLEAGGGMNEFALDVYGTFHIAPGGDWSIPPMYWSILVFEDSYAMDASEATMLQDGTFDVIPMSNVPYHTDTLFLYDANGNPIAVTPTGFASTEACEGEDPSGWSWSYD